MGSHWSRAEGLAPAHRPICPSYLVMAGTYPAQPPPPTVGAIRWTPRRRHAGALTEEAYAIFVTQSVLREIIEHAWSGPEEELLGFLLGELCESPDSTAHYIVITAAMRTGYAIP